MLGVEGPTDAGRSDDGPAGVQLDQDDFWVVRFQADLDQDRSILSGVSQFQCHGAPAQDVLPPGVLRFAGHVVQLSWPNSAGPFAAGRCAPLQLHCAPFFATTWLLSVMWVTVSTVRGTAAGTGLDCGSRVGAAGATVGEVRRCGSPRTEQQQGGQASEREVVGI